MVGDPDCQFDTQSIVLDQVEASSKSEASVGQIPKVHRQEVRLLIKVWIYSKTHEEYKKKLSSRSQSQSIAFIVANCAKVVQG